MSLKDRNYISFNYTGVGLYQFSKMVLPITIKQMKELFLNHIFISDKAILINKDTLQSEHVTLELGVKDYWLSEDGINSIINLIDSSI